MVKPKAKKEFKRTKKAFKKSNKGVLKFSGSVRSGIKTKFSSGKKKVNLLVKTKQFDYKTPVEEIDEERKAFLKW